MAIALVVLQRPYIAMALAIASHQVNGMNLIEILIDAIPSE